MPRTQLTQENIVFRYNGKTYFDFNFIKLNSPYITNQIKKEPSKITSALFYKNLDKYALEPGDVIFGDYINSMEKYIIEIEYVNRKTAYLSLDFIKKTKNFKTRDIEDIDSEEIIHAMTREEYLNSINGENKKFKKIINMQGPDDKKYGSPQDNKQERNEQNNDDIDISNNSTIDDSNINIINTDCEQKIDHIKTKYKQLLSEKNKLISSINQVCNDKMMAMINNHKNVIDNIQNDYDELFLAREQKHKEKVNEMANKLENIDYSYKQKINKLKNNYENKIRMIEETYEKQLIDKDVKIKIVEKKYNDLINLNDLSFQKITKTP